MNNNDLLAAELHEIMDGYASDDEMMSAKQADDFENILVNTKYGFGFCSCQLISPLKEVMKALRISHLQQGRIRTSDLRHEFGVSTITDNALVLFLFQRLNTMGLIDHGFDQDYHATEYAYDDAEITETGEFFLVLAQDYLVRCEAKQRGDI